MRKTGTLFIAALFAVVMAACGGTVENKPANTANVNANTSAEQPVTVAMLKDLEVKAFEAFKNKDTKYFETFLVPNFVMFERGKKVDRADAIKMIGEHKYDIKGFTFSEERLTKLSPTAAVLTMKVATDGTADGKKMPDAVAATLYVKEGTTWKAAWHSEVDHVTPPSQTDRSSAATKPAANDNAKTGDKADSAKPAEKSKAADKKDSPAPAKDAKSAETKPANSAASNASATSLNDETTTQLMAAEKAGWEAWKAKDWTKLGPMMTTEVMFVDPMGQVMAGRDVVVKGFTDMNCDVKSLSVTDGQSVAITADTAILFAKGNADAKCGDTKLGPVWVTAIYVKEGGNWKLGYHFEQPAK